MVVVLSTRVASASRTLSCAPKTGRAMRELQNGMDGICPRDGRACRSLDVRHAGDGLATRSPRRPRRLFGELVGGSVARQPFAAVLLSLGIGSCAYRLVGLEAGAESTADGCRRRDEPGEHEPTRVRRATHHAGFEDEECP